MKFDRTSFVTTINKLGSLASQHLPTLLGAAGTFMTIGAVISAAQTAPLVPEKIQEKEEEKGEELTTFEKGVVVASTCRESILLAGGGIALNWAAIFVGSRRISALSALYLLEKSQSEEFKDATKAIVKPSEFEKIKLKEAENVLAKNPVDSSKVQGDPNGEFLWYDYFCGRYFRASIAQVDSAFSTFNSRLYSREWMPLSDLYELFPNYEECTMGNYLGYDLLTMRQKCSNPMDARVEWSRSECRAASTGEPCYILRYTTPMPLESWRNWDTYDNQFNYLGV